MIYINKAKFLRVYNTQFKFPIKSLLNESVELLESGDLLSESTFNKGLLIYLLEPTLQDSLNLIKSQVYSKKYLNSFYYDLNNKNFKATKVLKANVNPTKEIYEKVKESVPIIKKTYRHIEQYNGYNLFYDKSIIYTKILDRYKGLNTKNLIRLLLTEMSVQLNKNSSNVSNFDSFYVLVNTDNTHEQSFVNIIRYIFRTNFYQMLNDLPELTFIFISDKNNKFFKFNTSHLKEPKNRTLFRKLLSLTSIGVHNASEELNATDMVTEKITDTQELIKKKLIDTVSNNLSIRLGLVNSLTGEPIDGNSAEIYDELNSKIEEVSTGTTEADILDELNDSDEFKQYLQTITEKKVNTSKSLKNTKRNDLLKEQQKNLKVNNKDSMEEIIQRAHSSSLQLEAINTELPTNLKKKYVPIIKKEVQYSSLKDFESNYNRDLNSYDRMRILKSFSENKEISMYITNIETVDSSDEFNKKETWTIDFEDDRRVKHKVKIDVPIFIDERHIFINGSKKNILKQLTFLPIVKIGANSVQVSSSCYGKTFISRYGQKLSSKVERIKKTLVKQNGKTIEVLTGNNVLNNSTYLTSLEYDELAAQFMYFKVPSTKLELYFSQKRIDELLLEKKLERNPDPYLLPIGFLNGKLLNIDTRSNMIVELDREFLDLIADNIKNDEILRTEFEQFKASKKFIYTRASLLNNKIPIGLFIAFRVGITELLRRAEIKHYFTDKKIKLGIDEKDNENVVEFANGYLHYDVSPFTNALLMNYFLEADTQSYNYELFDEKDVYLELFNNITGSRNISKGLNNFAELFVDPITEDVLKDLGLPTDFCDIMIYATRLLEDNSFIEENDMSNYRLRSNEIVNAYLYKIIADQYSIYRNSANSTNPVKVTVPRDKLLKELSQSPLIENSDFLNPALELERMSTATPKGLSGLTNIFSSL